jgi:hypothetical protein
MIISHTFSQVDYLVALAGAVFVFLQGDWSDFCQALGVFTLLVIQRASVRQFLGRFLTQVSYLLLQLNKQYIHKFPFI